ncbi:MAG: hypothetical protein HXY36_06745 [Chloroflexi bacterium]|nr:hypothetical protein [Chloroflexota bacterium]
MAVNSWQQVRNALPKRTSLVPGAEDIAESRAFIRKLFEEHYSQPRKRVKPTTADVKRKETG